MRNMPLARQNIWENSGFKLLKLYFNDANNTVIDNEEIYQEQLKIEETLCDESNIKYGKCSSKKFTVRIFASSLSFLNCKLRPTLTINPDTEFADTINLGTYNVVSEKRTADKMYKDIEAYDDLYIIQNADVADWYNGLTFPISLKNFRDSFFAYFNVIQETTSLPLDDLMIEKTINPSTLTGLTVIEAICEINGCFGQINYDGKFTYVYLHSKEDLIYPDNDLYPSDTLYPLGEYDYSFTMNDYVQNGVTYEDYITRSFTAIVVRQNENDAGGIYPSASASTDNPYTITNNFLVYGANNETLVRVAKTVYEQNVDVYYVPGKIKTWYKPWLELGDTVSAQTKTGMVYFPILKRTISGITAIFDEYESKGQETFNTKINSAGTQIEQLSGKTNELIRTVEETRSTLTDVEKGLKSEIKQTADAITAEVTRAQGAESSLSSKISQSAHEISLTTSAGNTSCGITIKLKDENGNELDSETANVQITGMVKFSDLSNQGSTTINGSNITTGTISASRIDTDNLTAKNLLVKDSSNNILINASSTNKTVTIGGFTVGSNGLWSGSGSGRAGIGTYGGNYAFWAGSDNSRNAPFMVDHSGNLTATSATISGTITGSSGEFTKGFKVEIPNGGNSFYHHVQNGYISMGIDGEDSQANCSITCSPGSGRGIVEVSGKFFRFNKSDVITAENISYNMPSNNINTSNIGSYAVLGNGGIRTLNLVKGGTYGQYVEVRTSGEAYGIDCWTSDTKLKTNIKETDIYALDKINAIDMIQFNWNGKITSNTSHVDLGISANQLQEVIPEAVNEVEQPEESEFDTIKQINGNPLISYCIKAIQELSAKIDEQQKEIDELKGEN